MEDGLREEYELELRKLQLKSLNPCFNGRWSARAAEHYGNVIKKTS